MRSSFIGMSVLIIFQTLMVAAPAASVDADYGIGAALAHCLAVKCQIFHGRIVTKTPKYGEPVAIRIQEWITGGTPGQDTINVPFEFLRSGAVFSAWEGLRPEGGMSVTVALALEDGWLVEAGQPVVVATGNREANAIRLLVREAPRLEASTAALTAAVFSLSHIRDPALAGYLVAFLTYPNPRGIALNGDLLAYLLSQLLGNQNVPVDATPFLLLKLGPVCKGLASPPVSVIRRFVDLAQQANAEIAGAALALLADSVGLDRLTAAGIPRETLIRLAAIYQRLHKNGTISRKAAWETLQRAE